MKRIVCVWLMWLCLISFVQVSFAQSDKSQIEGLLYLSFRSRAVCFDTKNGVFYFVLEKYPNYLISYDLDSGRKKVVKGFGKRFIGIDRLRCCGSSLLFNSRDRNDIRKVVPWEEVYEPMYIKVYYNLKTQRVVTLSDRWYLKFLSPNKLVGYEPKGYIAVIYLPNKRVRKLEVDKVLGVGFCPIGNRLFWYPETTETGQTTELLVRGFASNAPESRLVKEAGEFCEAEVIDKDTLLIIRESKPAYLYRLDTHRRVPLSLILNESFRVAKAGKDSFFVAYASSREECYLYHINLDGRILGQYLLFGWAEAMCWWKEKLYMALSTSGPFVGLGIPGLYVLK